MFNQMLVGIAFIDMHFKINIVILLVLLRHFFSGESCLRVCQC